VTGGTGFFVADANGTNILNVSSVMSWEPILALTKSHYTDVTIIEGDSSHGWLKGEGREISELRLNYDDTGRSTSDGKHTVFHLNGTASADRSYSHPAFLFRCGGSGSIRETNTILNGLIRGKALLPNGAF
jgi:hypothetical protein